MQRCLYTNTRVSTNESLSRLVLFYLTSTKSTNRGSWGAAICNQGPQFGYHWKVHNRFWLVRIANSTLYDWNGKGSMIKATQLSDCSFFKVSCFIIMESIWTGKAKVWADALLAKNDLYCTCGWTRTSSMENRLFPHFDDVWQWQ